MFLSDEEYNHAVAFLSGSLPKDPFMTEFSEWFESAFSLKLCDYICSYDGFLKLKLVLWDNSAHKKMLKAKDCNFDKKKQEKIRKFFSSLCVKYNVFERYQTPQNIFVCYETLKDEIIKRILIRASAEIKSSPMPNVWKTEIIFEGVHVFFETDEHLKRYRSNGTCDKINALVAAILKKYDTFGVFNDGFSCVFTSRQTLNEKYNGSMFYYTR